MTKKVPEAYQRGWQEFFGREFLVTNDTLIPRPETEQMVDLGLEVFGKTRLPGVRASKARRGAEGATILEVGTGSGCVIISLALEMMKNEIGEVSFVEEARGCEVSLAKQAGKGAGMSFYANDISKQALEVARKNAKRLGAEKIVFFQGDLLKFGNKCEGSLEKNRGRLGNSDEEALGVPEQFDVILANLPYVDRSWEWLDLEALGAEPETALFAEEGGLELIFELIREIVEQRRLKAGGFLILEADPCQHERIVEFGEKHRLTLDKIVGFQMMFRRG